MKIAKHIISVAIVVASAASTAQASPALPSQAQYNHMTCNQVVKQAMKMMRRDIPAWHWMTQAQLRKEAFAAVRAVETAYPHQPCRDPHPAATKSPSVTMRRPSGAGR